VRTYCGKPIIQGFSNIASRPCRHPERPSPGHESFFSRPGGRPDRNRDVVRPLPCSRGLDLPNLRHRERRLYGMRDDCPSSGSVREAARSSLPPPLQPRDQRFDLFRGGHGDDNHSAPSRGRMSRTAKSSSHGRGGDRTAVTLASRRRRRREREVCGSAGRQGANAMLIAAFTSACATRPQAGHSNRFLCRCPTAPQR